MRMLLLMVWWLFGLMYSVSGGSKCPSRRYIRPCHCFNVVHSKRSVSTIVICQNLETSQEFTSVLSGLPELAIDQFHLYDSFLNTSNDKQVLPMDWSKRMMTKELVISDSDLSTCFACQVQSDCENTIMTKFSVVNSSDSERICSVCDSNGGQRLPWTSCLKKLNHFQFTHGRLNSLSGDLFPNTMSELATLDLSHNRISKIDPNAFKNLPALLTLDLSHNSIEFIDHAFLQRRMKLQELDLSFNVIKQMWVNIFVPLPQLKSFNLANNGIQNFTFSHWQNPPRTLRTIDLSNNPLHCDCSLRWVNTTFKVHVHIPGSCTTPVELAASAVRSASRHLTERCTNSGRIGTRAPKRKSRN